MILTNSGIWKAMQQSLLCLTMMRKTSACTLEASATLLNLTATSLVRIVYRRLRTQAGHVDRLEIKQRREHVGRALRPDSGADPGASGLNLASADRSAVRARAILAAKDILACLQRERDSHC